MTTLMPEGFPNTGQAIAAPYGGLSLAQAFHITTSTTTHVATSTARLKRLVLSVSGSPSSWSVTVQDKSGTPKIVYTNSFSAATTAPVVLDFGDGILMTGGIDIVTSGATPGVLDAWVNT